MSITPIRVLLIDDDLGDIELARLSFEQLLLPIELQVANGGQIGLDILQELTSSPELSPPDLVVLDLQMPGLNGKDVLQEIRQSQSLQSLPVVMFSSSRAQQHIDEALSLGANRYILKQTGYLAFLDSVKEIEEFWINFSRNLN